MAIFCCLTAHFSWLNGELLQNKTEQSSEHLCNGSLAKQSALGDLKMGSNERPQSLCRPVRRSTKHKKHQSETPSHLELCPLASVGHPAEYCSCWTYQKSNVSHLTTDTCRLSALDVVQAIGVSSAHECESKPCGFCITPIEIHDGTSAELYISPKHGGSAS
jgi:hypothetical protein